jgi:hypothetical protein
VQGEGAWVVNWWKSGQEDMGISCAFKKYKEVSSNLLVAGGFLFLMCLNSK